MLMVMLLMLLLLLLLELHDVRGVLVDIVQLLIGRLGVASSVFGTCILKPNLLGAIFDKEWSEC